MKALLPERPEDILNMETDKLAGVVLAYLNGLPRDEKRRLLNIQNLRRRLIREFDGHDAFGEEVIDRILEGGFCWLIQQRMLIPNRSGRRGKLFYSISRPAQEILELGNLDNICEPDHLSKHSIHPVLAEKIWPLYAAAQYQPAVFAAFKAVEVEVRTVGGYEAEDIGVTLMRDAFHPDRGRLTKRDDPTGEREAVSHLFAGAIGLIKNRYSHRDSEVSEEVAIELIFLASHLFRIIDERSAMMATTNSETLV